MEDNISFMFHTHNEVSSFELLAILSDYKMRLMEYKLQYKKEAPEYIRLHREFLRVCEQEKELVERNSTINTDTMNTDNFMNGDGVNN